MEMPMTENADGYEITAYRPEFRAEVLELQQHMWGSDRERNAAYFEWKYERNPYSGSSFIYLALYEGQVAGMRAMFVTEWEAGQPSQGFQCLTDADAVVHPDHRGHRLLERMTRATLEGVTRLGFDYNVNLSASPVSAAIIEKVGWHSAFPLETASWHADGQEHSAIRALGAKLPLLRQVYRRVRRRTSAVMVSPAGPRLPFHAFDKRCAETDQGAGNHLSVGTSPQPEAMAGLVNRLGSDGRIRHVRDRRFFGWRFGNPLSVYRFLFWEDQELEGYLVLQAPVRASNGARIHIVDWEATSTQVRTELLQAAISYARSDHLVIWSATLPDEVKALLRDNGFHFSDMTKDTGDGVWHPHVLLRSVSRDIPPRDWNLAGRDVLDLANWDLRAIYSDSF